MKKIISKIIAAAMVFSVFSAFIPQQSINSAAYAEGTDKLTVSMYAMTGTLYYYDTPSGNIVLNDVKPLNMPSANESNGSENNTAVSNAAKALTYTEVPTADGGRFFNDGNRAASEWINNYVDRQIWFIAAVAADGSVTIPYFKIIV